MTATMIRMITIQPSATHGFVAEDDPDDGLRQLPYPFHVEYSGEIGRQDFWRGTPSRVIGFVNSPEDKIGLRPWAEFRDDPDQIIGRYVVTEDSEGCWATWSAPIHNVIVSY